MISSSLSSTGQQQTSLCNTASTPAQQVNGEQRLLAHDIQVVLPSVPPGELPKLTDMVAQVVHVIYEMSSRQEVPTEVHSGILSTLESGLSGTPTTATVADRPDSIWITSSSATWSVSMWISMLEAGHARSKKVTILNMIEWMGASEWYDAELQKAEKVPPLTKRGAPRKRLATVVLDKCLMAARDATAMESLKNVASNDNEACSSSLDSAVVQKKILDTRRSLLNIFHRGRTLRRLVQMTHLGILFDPDIWYVL